MLCVCCTIHECQLVLELLLCACVETKGVLTESASACGTAYVVTLSVSALCVSDNASVQFCIRRRSDVQGIKAQQLWQLTVGMRDVLVLRAAAAAKADTWMQTVAPVTECYVSIDQHQS